jgi:hypothetical protein
VTAASALEPTGPPVFVLAGGGRTGSTLVQRLLISTGEIMVWGEHGGVLLDALQRFVYGMRDWIEREGVASQREAFLQQRANAWISNINPVHDAFVTAARAALLHALAEPAAALGYRRWGFKEIRYNGTAIGLLKTLFPDAPIIVLVRHPAAMLGSIKVAPWYKKDYDARPEVFLGGWAAISSSLVAATSEFPGVLVLRYEDLTSDPQRALEALARHVNVDVERFDAMTLSVRQRGPVEEPSPLDERDRVALAARAVRQAALTLGYRLDERLVI